MTPAFASLPGAGLLFGVSLGFWFLLELRQAFRRRTEATNRDSGSLRVVRLWSVAGALIAALGLKVGATAFTFTSAIFAVSLVMIWSGAALRWWCFHTLGRYFTFTVMTSADQRVVSGGPYRFLRHPSYLGILLVLGGIGLSYGNWLSLAALTILPFVGFVHRIGIEERALSADLGDAYTSYAAGRKRLIPFVW